ncbi:hypothetical protein jhhlp_001323 [Lomentospora prolificans]|uniref:Uncharacterized protein n=1 Tax=Lomentospora prolificans TaxID=41688 RepID=A0A2N3NHW8_9PEZI|nr:hypothetical protein jhhlp_001323 [Lomentospora prolificans]
MKIPYSCLATHAELLFASRGGQIQVFNLEGGAPLSTWNHPDAEKEAFATQKSHNNAEEQPLLEPDDEPPQKKQRLEEDTDENEDDAPAQVMAGERVDEQAEIAKEEAKKKHARINRDPISKRPDVHIIVLLSVSQDGKYVAAVSGHDKVLWVFEHDGKGSLRESSRRAMPKRPCAIAMSSDNRAIILADKFGDVYALPVDPAKGSLAGEATSLHVKHQRDHSKPAANEYTVHSKINLRSLEMQQRALEKRDKDKEQANEAAAEEPAFEHTLILGHVSMLTDLIIGEYQGRRYIISCDRDEHIRVSRYIPQAYVIEAFCLGHKEFVNSIAVSETHPNLLVSGGGDESLFVWDWPTGRLVSEADLLSQARLATDVQNIAVQRIRSSPSGIFVICEGVPAAFHWRLSPEGKLEHCKIVSLPGNPLDISVSTTPEPKLIVAVDPSGAESGISLLAYTLANGDAWLLPTNSFDESAEASTVLEVSPTQVKKLLYTVESLRKRGAQRGEQDGQEE